MLFPYYHVVTVILMKSTVLIQWNIYLKSIKKIDANKTIIGFIGGGLGNRLFALLRNYYLYELYKSDKFYISWLDQVGFNCKFQDIFKNIKVDIIDNIDDIGVGSTFSSPTQYQKNVKEKFPNVKHVSGAFNNICELKNNGEYFVSWYDINKISLDEKLKLIHKYIINSFNQDIVNRANLFYPFLKENNFNNLEIAKNNLNDKIIYNTYRPKNVCIEGIIDFIILSKSKKIIYNNSTFSEFADLIIQTRNKYT
jgi:hypothetical protein